MALTGETGSAKCVVSYKNEKTYVNGRRRAFIGYKLEPLSEKNGIFVEWNIKNGSLKLVNDKFGFFPVYYTKTANGIAFSSSICDLLEIGDRHQLDDGAISLFLRTGLFTGDRTPFAKIKALPPSAELRFCKGHFFLDRNRVNSCQEAKCSISEAKNIYSELFRNSIRKFLNVMGMKVGVPLSGGRDSRHILFELISSGIEPFSCITVKPQPPKPDEDVKVARKVCEYLDVNHIILDQLLSFLDAEKEKSRITDFCSLEHSWILPLSKYLFEERYDCIFDGIGGDVLSAGLFLTKKRLTLYRKEKFEELANEIIEDEGNWPKYLTRSAYKRFNRDLAIDLLVAELKVHANAPNPVGQFFFWNRTRRNIALCSWKILSKKCHVFAPYLDSDLYEFLSSLPAEYFLDHMFHQRVIEEHYPAYAQLPYESEQVDSQPNKYVTNCYEL